MVAVGRLTRATELSGKHDDQVDALGLIGEVLDRMGKGTALPSTDQESGL
jgi:hypothetical protein